MAQVSTAPHDADACGAMPIEIDLPMVVDNFLADPDAARAGGLAAPFIDWQGMDGQIYKRVCLVDIAGVREAVELAMGGPVEMLGMGYRLNYAGELPNAAIHSDMGWGTHALVLYLSDGKGGTAFWRHLASGAHRIDPSQMDVFEAVNGDWDDASRWQQRHLVQHKFNRGVIYESALFHSRWPFAAFGTGPDDGRLIAVAFFNKCAE